MEKEVVFPLVSVIIPVYNVSRFIGECLESISVQSLSDIEVICIDDGSEDNSFEIVDTFAGKDPRIKVCRQKNRGVSAARNEGLKRARGKYVLFVDADDWIESSMLHDMVNEAENKNADVVICSAEVQFYDKSIFSFRNRRSLRASLKTSNWMWERNEVIEERWNLLNKAGSWPFVWNKLIRRDLLEQYGVAFSEELALGEDGVFLQILFQYVKKVQCIQQKFYNYRYLRNDSATIKLAVDRGVRFQKHVKIVEELLKELQWRGLFEENAPYALRWLLRFLYGDFLLMPEEQRKECSGVLHLTLQSSGILDYQGALTSAEKEYLGNLLTSKAGRTEWKRLFEYVWYKVQMKIICKNKKGL